MKGLIDGQSYLERNVPSSELAGYLFRFVEEKRDADLAINSVLDKIGRMFSLDSIAIKELVEQNQAVRCTYEWSSSGESFLLNTERRFFKSDIEVRTERFGGRKDGYFIFHKTSDSAVPFHLVRAEKVVTLLDMPIYKGDEYLGCINFTDYTLHREWKESDIIALQNVCRVLGSYIFGLRVRKADKDAVRDLMLNDPITGLPNYDIFQSRVRRALKIKDGMSVAIISADVVNFKYINEKFGYEVGDRILKVFIDTLYGFFDRIVCCCREYSDNFICAIKFMDDIDSEAVRFKVDRFVHAFYDRIEEMELNWRVGINSGIYMMSDGDEALDDAITKANAARKESKKHKGTEVSRSSVYSEDMIEGEKKELALVSSVDQAIDNREFKVFYQPKFSCDGRAIKGAEALIRWQKQDGSFIYPDQFIPAFEHDGCIIKTDYYVYEHVFKYQRDRLDAGLQCVPISMNVSRYHLFSRAFISCIELLQTKYKLPPELLEFEITENMYMGDFPTAKYTLDKLRAMHMSISMDDFGSQFSSIEILTRFPIDTIKLDKVFMKEKLENVDKILISCIIDMAKKLKMQVLCEGVENEEQRAFLEDACCDLIQGYIFSKPVEEKYFDEMLEKQFA